jgi:hypothetical protein
MKHIITVLLLTLMSTVGLAGSAFFPQDKGYSCLIVIGYMPNDDGKLVEFPLRGGYEFTIDRGTGRTIGALSNYATNTLGDFQPTVLHRGNKEQYFKAVTIYPTQQPLVETLIVEEFAETKEKPFVFTRNAMIITGTCESI